VHPPPVIHRPLELAPQLDLGVPGGVLAANAVWSGGRGRGRGRRGRRARALLLTPESYISWTRGSACLRLRGSTSSVLRERERHGGVRALNSPQSSCLTSSRMYAVEDVSSTLPGRVAVFAGWGGGAGAAGGGGVGGWGLGAGHSREGSEAAHGKVLGEEPAQLLTCAWRCSARRLEALAIGNGATHLDLHRRVQ
jgi:hypothetical protein